MVLVDLLSLRNKCDMNVLHTNVTHLLVLLSIDIFHDCWIKFEK